MKRWKQVKTNLWRNQESGTYFARTKIKGKDTWRTLETDSRAVADLKLPAKLAKMRASGGAFKGASGGNLTLPECAAIYLERKRERGYRRRNQAAFKPLKPRSLAYRQETVEGLRRLWPSFDERRAAAVTEQECNQVADRARRRYGATRFNGILQTMRGMLAVAIEAGCLESNPAAGIGTAEVKAAQKTIPTREQFTEILRRLDGPTRRKYARLSVRALAFTGLRPNEARCLKPEDVNLKSGVITARQTKNGKPRVIQLIPQAAELFEEEGVNRVLRALKKCPRKALMTIGRDVGLKLTPYTFRHLHMTELVESGVDIATAAAIAGHQDRGVTLLRNYLHARPEHVRQQLGRVRI